MLGALLAWESGAGRGHVVTLKTVAEAVSDRFTFDAALKDLTFKDELAGLCDPVQGPWLPFSGEYRRSRGNPRASTWGEFMGDVGFRSPDILRQSIDWWQEVMRDCDISLLIADSAPCALLAARGLGIPSVAVGTGYLLPPSDMETFPVLLPRHSTRIYDEAEIVETINSVIPQFGVPEIDRLPGVYACCDQLAFTLEMLDPYTPWRSGPLLPPIIGGAPVSASGGDEVFVYFSTSEKSDPRLMDALGGLGLPMRVFIPGLDEEVAADFTRRGIQVEQAPVPVELVAKRTRLLVNAAQHGTLCMGVSAGLPQVSVPQHREQEYHAEAVKGRGALVWLEETGRDTGQVRSVIRNAYEDAGMAGRARHLSHEVGHVFLQNQRKSIRRRIAEVMDHRV